ncbi:SDR family NAD(P)-dependent oxidoreductase [Streptomyces sp. JV176]|uniref:SDR family NAD(P)-dependent oxidoreductase n=1 Tax=Streptomyces sp. JV176 TaxID=858630 RepID=UPI002E75C37F|nr:SDR family NAD(P)-dependent oxidoreductase [Streptomyces sp. JV176]MEE1799496.1 SDR family NAD(P)-dependent oxidoreductase [Streptomyces sp. JV176]
MGLLDGKVVMVTGAGNGIGRTSATLFAAEGASVVLADVSDTAGEAVLSEIRAAGGVGTYVHCDVSVEEQAAAAVRTAVDSFGRLDGAFNNAGVGHPQVRMGEIDLADWERTLAVNLTGTWLCQKYQLKQMLEQKSGSIVNQSSSTGVAGVAMVGAYGTTKAAIIHMTELAAMEYGAFGVRLNALAPGPILTEATRRAITERPELEADIAAMVPMGRVGQASEVAESAAWLLSDRASFVTGATLSVDGGQAAKS